MNLEKKGKHPTAHFGCTGEQCRSPIACGTFGYCRSLNQLPRSGGLICTGCLKRPADLECYREAVRGNGDEPTPENCERYVLAEEGTLNPENHHFLCDGCYIDAGMPTAPGRGWVAP